ncbi:MAG: hypothetical protein ACLPTF_10210 [Steroidobacteraceae bacterium]
MDTLTETLAMVVALSPMNGMSEQFVRDAQQNTLKRLVGATRAHAKLNATATARESISAALGADVFELFETRFAQFGIKGIGDVQVDDAPRQSRARWVRAGKKRPT